MKNENTNGQLAEEECTPSNYTGMLNAEARLMRAAPGMLKALEGILEVAQHNADYACAHGYEYSGFVRIGVDAKEAIAKATGEPK